MFNACGIRPARFHLAWNFIRYLDEQEIASRYPGTSMKRLDAAINTVVDTDTQREELNGIPSIFG